jgi:transcriptional regulator with XRE-family HTH domain
MTTPVPGDRIRAWRKRLDVNQRDLAKRIGILPSTLCHIEKGRVKASALLIERVAKALGISAAAMYGDLPEPREVG